MNPGIQRLTFFSLSEDATCVMRRHGNKETFLILSTVI